MNSCKEELLILLKSFNIFNIKAYAFVVDEPAVTLSLELASDSLIPGIIILSRSSFGKHAKITFLRQFEYV